MVRFLSGRMSFTVMYSTSTYSDLWTSVDGMLVLTSVSTPLLGLSARSTRCISYPQMENLCVLLRWVSWISQTSIFCFCVLCFLFLLRFEELLKSQVSFVAPFLHSSARCEVFGDR